MSTPLRSRILRTCVYIWILIPGVTLLTGCDSGQTGPDVGEPTIIEDSVVDLNDPWLRAEPAQVRIEPERLATAVRLAGDIDRLRSLLVVRNGRLVVEEYYGGRESGTLHDVRSVTKSVVATLVGIAIEQGHLPGTDAPIGNYITDDVATLTAQQKSITFEHLLTMTGGFEWPELNGNAYGEWIRASDQLQHVFDQPMAAAPGTAFNYNSGAVHALGVALRHAVGMPLPEYADQALFSRIGIDRARWEDASGGFVNGGSGIDLRARDLARLGQLYLQEGVSGTEQIVSSDWIIANSTPQFGWRDTFGPLRQLSYGRLWWTESGQAEPAFFAWGFGGQFIYVVPDLRLVAVTTTEWQGGADIPALEKEALTVILHHVVAAARLGSQTAGG